MTKYILRIGSAMALRAPSSKREALEKIFEIMVIILFLKIVIKSLMENIIRCNIYYVVEAVQKRTYSIISIKRSVLLNVLFLDIWKKVY